MWAHMEKPPIKGHLLKVRIDTGESSQTMVACSVNSMYGFVLFKLSGTVRGRQKVEVLRSSTISSRSPSPSPDCVRCFTKSFKPIRLPHLNGAITMLKGIGLGIECVVAIREARCHIEYRNQNAYSE
ncbi:hypothetical protein GOBAR_AA06978 [Gossypium barbadense]|uniref:Uncharacterized protein n=1 Tax=Gossypium barbadense TaxID=3634 RepID=A0A2P5YDC4_GOSBA|nr:hypothetical protein GOBAR_AA06978 [Gossypium barbadense]